MWLYAENREKFMITQRMPKGFQDAINVMEDLVKKATPSASSVCIRIYPCVLMFCDMVCPLKSGL